MTERRQSELVDYDAADAVQRTEALAGDELLLCAAYTPDHYDTLYVAQSLWEEFDKSEVQTIANSLHDYVDLDFQERELFTELFPNVHDTNAFVTYTDRAIMVRLLAETEGLFLSLKQGVDITPIVEELLPIIQQKGL